MSEDIKLKLCPFCKQEAHFIQSDEAVYSHYPNWDVCCGTTDCYLELGAGWYVTKEEAAEMWNNRK